MTTTPVATAPLAHALASSDLSWDTICDLLVRHVATIVGDASAVRWQESPGPDGTDDGPSERLVVHHRDPGADALLHAMGPSLDRLLAGVTDGLVRPAQPVLVRPADDAALRATFREPTHRRYLDRFGVGVVIVFPLSSAGDDGGPTLCTWRDAGSEPFTDDDVALLGHLAAWCGVALRQARRLAVTQRHLDELNQRRAETEASHRHEMAGRQQTETMLRREATLDPLTHLPNRSALHRSLSRWIDLAAPDERLAVLFLDLDGFKSVNDTYGHLAGDDVLRAAAHRLTNVVRRQDLICRYGGDEFVVVVESGPGIEGELETLVSRICDAFDEPFSIGGHCHAIGVSIGVAVHPEDGGTISSLLSAADTAMYEDKRRQR